MKIKPLGDRVVIKNLEAEEDLLHFILSDETQHITTQVHYAPLPKKAIELSRRNLQEVTFDGKPISHE